MTTLLNDPGRNPTGGSTSDLRPITGAFGAEISADRLAAAVAAGELPALLGEHLLLVVRDHRLTPADQVSLARALGEPTPAHPIVPGLPGYPEVLVLDGKAGGKNARWHTDVTFLPNPHAASVLVAEVLPPRGGDTQWADLATAYERLSPRLRDLVDGLQAVHRISPLAYWGEPFDTALDREDAAQLLADAARVPAVVHPVVRVHPVTGRRSLFVNRGFTSHLVGASRIESEHLLGLLYAHIEQPEFTLRHRWQPDDVLIWDNRATSHYAVDDYEEADRRVRRVTVRGEVPVGPDGFASHPTDDPLLTVR